MKRASVTASGKPNNARSRHHGRPKAIQACVSCRKGKARCEILGNIKPGIPVQCHRCEVLHASCSYSEMDRNLFKPKETPPSEAEPSKPEQGIRHRLTFEGPVATSDGPMIKFIHDAALTVQRKDSPDHAPPFWVFLQNYNVDWTAPMTGINEIARKIYQPPYQSYSTTNSITSMYQESPPFALFIRPRLQCIARSSLRPR